MIIINPQEVFSFLGISNNIDEQLVMFDTSYKSLVKAWLSGKSGLLQYLIDNQINSADFINSINQMIDLYSKKEDYTKCAKLTEICKFIYEKEQELNNFLN